MSYDIRFAVKVEGTPYECYAIIGEPEYSSPTYNLGKMFRACMNWDYEQGKFYRVSDVLPKIEHGLNELRFHRDKYKKYEPENGWGTVGSAEQCLDSISRYFDESNFNGIAGSWNSEIPIECIWMAW